MKNQIALAQVRKIIKGETRPLQTLPIGKHVLYIVGIPYDEEQIDYVEPFTERAKAEIFVAEYQVKHNKRVYIQEIDLVELYG